MPIQRLATVRSIRTRITVTVDLPTSHVETLRDDSASGNGYTYRPTTVIVTYEAAPGEPWRLVGRIDILGNPIVDGQIVTSHQFTVYASALPNMPLWLRAIVADAEPTIRAEPRLRGDSTRIDPELRGSMQDGYTSEDVNRVLGQISDDCGLRLVCVWDYYEGFTGGDSNFYVDPEDGGPLRELAGDLWRWLNEDPDDPDTPVHPGDTTAWVGSTTAMYPNAMAWDDGQHNLAVRDDH
jgi:hypothetical protein